MSYSFLLKVLQKTLHNLNKRSIHFHGKRFSNSPKEVSGWNKEDDSLLNGKKNSLKFYKYCQIKTCLSIFDTLHFIYTCYRQL
ncbi:Hypothetical protein A7A1_1528 [Bacillus subtilis subsp. subtilis str. BSP1]|nr:Hypothetical protein A7A1_1528 [Bacillus subtilis subsp. subtilis str. BSP1]